MKPGTLLRDLVALPSVNPAFLPSHHPRSGEARVADFLAAAAAKVGLDVELQPVLPGRSNLIARLSPTGKVRQRILLAPHLDTVNGSEDQFTPTIRGGRLFGRGACDTKGSIAAMFGALCELACNHWRSPQAEMVLAGLVDEESGQAGSRALVASGFAADLAIVGEPTSLKLVTAHKGNIWLRMEARGKAAHGARPELGRNAVHMMARVVDLLQTTYAAQLRRRSHPLLGSPTVSVGMMSGGTQANIVPDRCAIMVDRRTLPGEREVAVRREISSLLRRNRLRAKILNAKLASCLPLETDPRLPLVGRFLRVCAQRKPAGVHYFCDASILGHGGIPSVVFGPGDIAQAHTTNEWISLRSLERAQAILVRFLQSFS